MIRVDIVNVFLTAKGDEFIILLKGADDERTLPVSIGQLEAQSIAVRLYHVSFPRPLTHDLFKTVLERLGSKVTKVVISDLIDNTFYARLTLETEGKTMEIDSRPSDAIALALRFGAPIFVEEKLMNESGVLLPPEQESAAATAAEPRKERKGPPSLETLKADLAKAVKEERYEDASKLRDEINTLTKSN